MNSHNEAFVHFDICAERLNSTLLTLNRIKEHCDHPLVGPAFRFALIEYAMPYTRSDGKAKKRHSLDTRYVPQELLPLHERLIASRNQIHAHVDLTVLEPTISYHDLDGERLVLIAQNNISGLEELPQIDEIICLVEGTLKNMYADRDNLKKGLES